MSGIPEGAIYAENQLKDGIIYTRVNPDFFITLEIAKIIIQERYKLNNGISYPILVDISGVKGATKEARMYIASEEGSRYLKARAVLVKSKLQVIAVNFYINFDKPSIDTRLFFEEKEAVQWLEKYK
jgi:hypothetical protein